MNIFFFMLEVSVQSLEMIDTSNSILLPYMQPENPADGAWKDMGMGQLSVKCREGASKATKESKPTVVVRNDVCLLF